MLGFFKIQKRCGQLGQQLILAVQPELEDS